jgi:hypothetical protein
MRRVLSSFVSSMGMVGSLALLAVLAFAGMALAAAPAFAEETHVFAGSFGSEGEGAGQFKDPSGVAVNDATGDVYVADKVAGVEADRHYAVSGCRSARGSSGLEDPCNCSPRHRCLAACARRL